MTMRTEKMDELAKRIHESPAFEFENAAKTISDALERDAIVEKNVALLRARSAVGIAKYGTTLERDDVDLLGWLKHAREECADQLNYLTAAITRLEGGK